MLLSGKVNPLALREKFFELLLLKNVTPCFVSADVEVHVSPLHVEERKSVEKIVPEEAPTELTVTLRVAVVAVHPEVEVTTQK